MYKPGGILFAYAESPVHMGAGTSLGAVDLPIQRERFTDYPMGQASGLKGCLRELFAKTAGNGDPDAAAKVKLTFGPDQKASEHAGALSVSDLRLLVFPVRSLLGTFAFCTSRYALARFARDVESTGAKLDVGKLPPEPGENEALCIKGTKLAKDSEAALEEFVFKMREDADLGKTADALSKAVFGKEEGYFPAKLRNDLVLLNETSFRDFVKMSTMVEAHIKIDDDTGTVKGGALWYAENLPPESVMYSAVFAADPFGERRKGFETSKDVLAFIKGTVHGMRLQIGGDETVGRGLMRLMFSPEPEKSQGGTK